MDRYLINVCGPNGAGKSTFTKSVLSTLNIPIVDPDLYSSQGIGEIAAGKLAIRIINEYLLQGVSFIKESTLTSNFDIRTLQKAKEHGYDTILVYLTLPSVELSLQRVARRVKTGGHYVSEEVIYRRFEKSLKNLSLIRESVDYCYIINGTDDYPLKAKFHIVEGLIKSITPIPR